MLQKRFAVCLILMVLVGEIQAQSGYDRFPRVRKAEADHWVDVKTRLALQKIDTNAFDLYLRVFKMEQVVEVWAKSRNETVYKQVENFPVCSSVGTIGPKLRQGDYQIPEGFYLLTEFNPASEFHLSLKINYPNRRDSIVGEKGNLGGMIFIHGGCETIGCVPLGNDNVSRLYIYAMKSRQTGCDSLPVHIYPARLNFANYRMLIQNQDMKANHRFWGSLRTSYLFFEEYGNLPKIEVNENGEYLFYKVGNR